MTIRDYEAMFLLDNTRASEDFEGAAAQVDDILTKHGAEFVIKEKWDERKLAYEIKGHRRATYYLVYFRAPTTAIQEINADVLLSEIVLRHLVMVLDEPIETHVEKRAQERERLAEESRKSSLSSWGGGRKGPSRRDRDGRDRDRDRDGRSSEDDGDRPSGGTQHHDKEGDSRSREHPAPASDSAGGSE